MPPTKHSTMSPDASAFSSETTTAPGTVEAEVSLPAVTKAKGEKAGEEDDDDDDEAEEGADAGTGGTSAEGTLCYSLGPLTLSPRSPLAPRQEEEEYALRHTLRVAPSF